MRIFHYLFVPCVTLLLFTSCNQNEGLGGSSSIEGYVYSIVHQNDNYSLSTDTVPAAEEKIYIVYSDDEDDPIADKRVETNRNGMYCFQYLRKGNYIVYAYSSYPEQLNKEKIAELQHVKVGSGIAQADPIYIHSGKGYGLSMIKGKVMAQYFDRGFQRGDPIPPVDSRVYLQRSGEDAPIDNARVSNEGIFIFPQVSPGTYELYTITERIGSRRPEYPTEPVEIEVVEAHKIYELPEVITIIRNI